MKKYLKTITFFCLALSMTACKKEAPSVTFEHTEKPLIINCDGLENAQLLNEAFHTFEKDLEHYYLKNSPNK